MAAGSPRLSVPLGSGPCYDRVVSPKSGKVFKSDRLRGMLTPHQRHLCLVMVGLPGRGKSFIGRKLEVFMKWKDGGHEVKLFNVGKYRRNIGDANSGSAAFFDPKNSAAVTQRQQAAADAMQDMLDFFKAGGEVGIYDATNSTCERRRWIMEQCQGRGIAVVFIESICDDPEVLEENFLNKVRHSPDFAGVDFATAMADLRSRIENYEKVYETISDDSLTYIKLYNLQSRVMCNKAYGRLTKSLLPFLTAINIAPRPIWLARSGLPVGEVTEEDHNPSTECLVSPLSVKGEQFAVALGHFTEDRMADYMATIELANPAPNVEGRSLTRCVTRSDGQINYDARCKVMVSTLPRAAATCRHLGDVETETFSQLNPLDKGVYEGMTLKDIEQQDPEFWEQFMLNRLETRFPGGESFKDLVSRLEPCLIEAEQQTAPVLIVSHTTVVQMLYAYYRQVPLSQAVRLRVEPHTVYELAPLMGGMWNVTAFKLDTSGPVPCLVQTEAPPPSPEEVECPFSPIPVPSAPSAFKHTATPKSRQRV